MFRQMPNGMQCHAFGGPDPARYRAELSLAYLAGCKSLSGKTQPVTRIESWDCGGVDREIGEQNSLSVDRESCRSFESFEGQPFL